MPIVRVEMWPGRTHEQKSKLAKAITEAMSDIAGAPPEATIIVFEAVSKDHWADSGTLASDASRFRVKLLTASFDRANIVSDSDKY